MRVTTVVPPWSSSRNLPSPSSPGTAASIIAFERSVIALSSVKIQQSSVPGPKRMPSGLEKSCSPVRPDRLIRLASASDCAPNR